MRVVNDINMLAPYQTISLCKCVNPKDRGILVLLSIIKSMECFSMIMGLSVVNDTVVLAVWFIWRRTREEAFDDGIIPHFFCLPKAHLILMMLCCQESEILLSVFFEIRFSQLSLSEHSKISKRFCFFVLVLNINIFFRSWKFIIKKVMISSMKKLVRHQVLIEFFLILFC